MYIFIFSKNTFETLLFYICLALIQKIFEVFVTHYVNFMNYLIN
jgi:hypothetical protein